MSSYHHQQQSHYPGGSAKLRQNRRLTEMSAQESLISKKKAEIEDRLRQKEEGTEEDKPSGPDKNNKATPPHAPAPAPAPPSLVNKFANDGSFMEQFLLMKRKKEEEEDLSKTNAKVPRLQEESKGQDKEEEEEEEEKRTLPSSLYDENHSGSSPCPTSFEIGSSQVTLPPSRKEEESSLLSSMISGPSSEKEAGVLPSAASFSSSSSDGAVVVGMNGESSPVQLSTVAEELASMVAVSGDSLEEVARLGNADEDELSFLYNTKGEVYQAYRKRVNALRSGIIEEHRQVKEGNGKKRRTRWGDENDKVAALAHPEKSQELLMYAVRVFGSIDIEPHQWRQCEDQLKMNLVYEDILKKQEETRKLAAQGKHKYEYDSDEDVEGGTWEHKARRLEMEKTMKEAEKLTESARGKHHIGDFLPPEELSKFMAKYQALKDGKDIDESDYLDHKLTEDNKGFKLLQKMGWSEGGGLGSSGQGITTPISNNGQGSDKKGLGVTQPHELDKTDDEFDAYRKRMMMAYRFRPNPLNNPRRAYY